MLPVGRPADLTRVDVKLLRHLREGDSYPNQLQNRTRLDKQTVISALKKIARAKFIEGRLDRTPNKRRATFYSLHPLVRELLELNFDVGCHILRETLVLERRYPRAAWRALLANSFKLYEFANAVSLPTRKGSRLDTCVIFYHLQYLAGPPVRSDSILPSKAPPVSLEEAVGPGPYHFIDGKQMSPSAIEDRISELALSVTTYLGDAPNWIRKLPEDYYGKSEKPNRNTASGRQ
jgi:DNA-binding MarR family transcriptional regulator